MLTRVAPSAPPSSETRPACYHLWRRCRRRSAAGMDEPKPKKPGVFKRALLNQYNLIMMGGVGIFALATGSLLPVMLGAGAEVLWLVLGADTSAFRRWVDKQDSKDAKQAML